MKKILVATFVMLLLLGGLPATTRASCTGHLLTVVIDPGQIIYEGNPITFGYVSGGGCPSPGIKCYTNMFHCTTTSSGTILLSETPTGALFDHWEGCDFVQPATNECSVNMASGPRTVTAIFRPDPD